MAERVARSAGRRVAACRAGTPLVGAAGVITSVIVVATDAVPSVVPSVNPATVTGVMAVAAVVEVVVVALGDNGGGAASGTDGELEQATSEAASRNAKAKRRGEPVEGRRTWRRRPFSKRKGLVGKRGIARTRRIARASSCFAPAGERRISRR